MARLLKFIHNRLIISFLVIFIAVNYSYSQNRENYGLLWKIEKKGSDKVSYLFGTMHLQDNRLFQFTDEMLPALKNTEVFAMEIHPDTVSNYFQEKFSAEETENIYKKILNEDDYKRLDTRFTELTGNSLDSLTNFDSEIIEAGLTEEPENDDDQITFLDVYLYEIAKQYGKELVGLEDIKDQLRTPLELTDEVLKQNVLELLDMPTSDYQGYLEEMIQIYYEGDLEVLYNYAIREDGIDEKMLKRNDKMVRNMKEIMQQQSLFTAVGAAHLPGKRGIIEQLRNDGYTVTKMPNNFTKTDGAYQLKPDINYWIEEKNENTGYSLKIPVKSTETDFNEFVKGNIAVDIVSNLTYLHMSFDFRSMEIKKGYNLLSEILKRLTKQDSTNILAQKDIQINGIDLKEFIIKVDDVYQRAILGTSNDIMYAFFVIGKEKQINNDYSDTFFKSIKISKTEVVKNEWKNFINEEGAYSIDFPKNKIRDLSTKVPIPLNPEAGPMFINIFMASDNDTHTSYLFRYNDQPTGYYLEDEASAVEEFTNYFKGFTKIVNDPIKIEAYGTTVYEYDLNVADTMHIMSRVFHRGNRMYLLMAQKDGKDEKIEKDDRFFKSFKFLDYKPQPFDTVVKVDEKFSFNFPKQFSKISNITEPEEDYSYDYNEDRYTQDNIYSSIQKGSGGAYMVEHIKLKKYFRENSLLEFYDNYAKLLVDQGDSLYNMKNITLANLPAKEFYFRSKNSNSILRAQMVLDGNDLIVMQVYTGEEEYKTNEPNNFYGSLKKIGKAKKFNLTDFKAEEIFKDIESKDPKITSDALGAFSYYIFSPEEFKILEKNLDKRFKNDSITNLVKQKLIPEIALLGNENTLVKFAQKVESTKESNYNKLLYLNSIAKIPTKNAIPTYLDLLEKNPLAEDTDSYLSATDALYDSIPFKIYKDKIIKLIPKENLRAEVIMYLRNEVMYDSLQVNILKPFEMEIFKYAVADVERAYEQLSNEEFSDYYKFFAYLKLADTLQTKNEDVKKMIDLLSVPNEEMGIYITKEAIITALNLDIQIEEKFIIQAMDSLNVRFEIMSALVKNNRASSIPSKYLSEENFAQLSVFNTLMEYEEEPEILNLIGEISIEEKDYYIFEHGYNYEGEETRYMAITQKIKPDPQNLKLNKCSVDYNVLQKDWEAQAKELIKENDWAE